MEGAECGVRESEQFPPPYTHPWRPPSRGEGGIRGGGGAPLRTLASNTSSGTSKEKKKGKKRRQRDLGAVSVWWKKRGMR